MVCCRCNRAGYCRGCACVKAKRTCDNCLPGKLGYCANKSTTNGNSNIIVGEPPPHDPCSAINPANRNFTHPQSDSNSEPSSVQWTDSYPSHPLLPAYPPTSSPTFTWGNFSGPELTTLLVTTYAEVVHWRRNCFSARSEEILWVSSQGLSGIWVNLNAWSCSSESCHCAPHSTLSETKQKIKEQRSHQVPWKEIS